MQPPSPEHALALRPPRLFDGPGSLLAGARFVVLRPASWRLAIVPVLVALVTLTALSVLWVWGAIRLAASLAASLGGAWQTVGGGLFTVVFVAAALPLAWLTSLALAQPLSGFALDGISRAIEQDLGGPARPDGAFWPSLFRSLRVTLAALAVGAPLLVGLSVVSLAFPPAAVVTFPLKALVVGLLVAWDLLDYPFSLRGMRVRARLRWIADHFGAVLLFGLLLSAAMLVPVVGLLVLPIGVAGATHLVVRHERRLG